jgi:hypothetical protein
MDKQKPKTICLKYKTLADLSNLKYSKDLKTLDGVIQMLLTFYRRHKR